MSKLKYYSIKRLITELAYPSMIILIVFSCSFKDYAEHTVSFSNPEDNVKLSGTLTLPEADSLLPAVVLIHGSGAHDRDLVMGKHKIFKAMADHLASKGFAVLRYDKRGCGKSGGIYSPFDLESFTSDGLAGIEFLRDQKEIDTSKIGAIGISQGGIVTPLMASKSEKVKFIVIMAGMGVKAQEALHASQISISRLAGYEGEQLEQVADLSNQIWKILIKKDITEEERNEGIQLLKKMWEYIDDESRQDFGFLEQNAAFFFNDIYRADPVIDFYEYDPQETLISLTCPVLAINGEKDVQVVAEANMPAIEHALESGSCPKYKTLIIKDHNHIFQKCETGKIAEYKYIDHAISQETIDIMVDWMKELD